MNELKEKYDGKRLSTDEVGQARSAINKAVKELEEIKYETGPDHLLFKWGTLKSWKLTSEKGQALLKKYFDMGSSASAITQHDTHEQKELICQMIDECDGTLGSDWSGDSFTRAEAKAYVMGYGEKTDV